MVSAPATRAVYQIVGHIFCPGSWLSSAKFIFKMLVSAPAAGAVQQIDCRIPGLCACHLRSLPKWWLDPWSLHCEGEHRAGRQGQHGGQEPRLVDKIDKTNQENKMRRAVLKTITIGIDVSNIGYYMVCRTWDDPAMTPRFTAATRESFIFEIGPQTFQALVQAWLLGPQLDHMDGAWAWHLQRPPPGDWKWCLGSRKTSCRHGSRTCAAVVSTTSRTARGPCPSHQPLPGVATLPFARQCEDGRLPTCT